MRRSWNRSSAALDRRKESPFEEKYGVFAKALTLEKHLLTCRQAGKVRLILDCFLYRLPDCLYPGLLSPD